MINRCFLAGNLTGNPQLRSTTGGTSILDFGLAVNDRYKNQQTGEWEDRPNFFNCKIFGRRAEALSSILTKGMHVSIEGKLQWSSWDDKTTGQKRSKIEVVVDEIELMSQRQQGGQQYAQPAPQQQYRAPQQAPQMAPQPAPAPMQQAPMQQQMPQMAPQQQYQPTDYYSEDIPF